MAFAVAGLVSFASTALNSSHVIWCYLGSLLPSAVAITDGNANYTLVFRLPSMLLNFFLIFVNLAKMRQSRGPGIMAPILLLLAILILLIREFLSAHHKPLLHEMRRRLLLALAVLCVFGNGAILRKHAR